MMWSLSKIIHTPEMVPAYITSFRNAGSVPLVLPTGQKDTVIPRSISGPEADLFFEAQRHDLVQEIMDTPLDNTTNKVNDLLRRGRLLVGHARLLDRLSGLIGWFGGRRKMREVINSSGKL